MDQDTPAVRWFLYRPLRGRHNFPATTTERTAIMGRNLLRSWRESGLSRVILAGGLLAANLLFQLPQSRGGDERLLVQVPVAPANKDNISPTPGQANGVQHLLQDIALPAKASPPQLPPAQLEPTDLA